MQNEYKINVNKKIKINETYFYFYFFYFYFSFYFFSYHISDSLSYLSHQIITAEHKMSHISHSKKMFKNLVDQLHVILVARNKIKKTSKWINTNEKKQKSIMNYMKKNMMCEKENHDFSNKKYKQF